ncbi:MAG TPA: agmatinase [Gemmatimonadota bacterium]|nr:agmatinase [Gemmatimonadota bacterium]
MSDATSESAWPAFLGDEVWAGEGKGAGSVPGPERDNPAAIILPVPYDLSSSWMKGADRGPRALLEASAYVELYDIETDSEPWLHGIETAAPVECDEPPEELARLVHRRVAEILERGALPVVLGGEHSVTIGAVDAAAADCEDAGRAFSVLQIDAHADTRESYHGSRYNHACVMARAREHGPIVQVGIRAIDASERAGLDEERVIWAHEIAAARARADTGWMDRAIDGLVDDVYLTIDLDAFDPSVVPATGTPEPGGLEWYEVNELVRRLAARRRLVGFDVVELLPQPGHHASDFLAAKLVYRVLAETLGAR